jgi:hypothetical protein
LIDQPHEQHHNGCPTPWIKRCRRPRSIIKHPTSWRRQRRSRLTKLAWGDNGDLALTKRKHALPRVRIVISIWREAHESWEGWSR